MLAVGRADEGGGRAAPLPGGCIEPADGLPVQPAPHRAAGTPGAGPGMLVALIRHAPTQGNLEGRYVGGALDEGLCEQGRELAGRARAALAALDPQAVVTSGMARCEQTAGLLFPAAPRRACAGLREMLFGAFEGMTFAELAGDASYQAWVDSGCTGRCPGGEDMAGFVGRVRTVLEDALDACAREGLARVCLVVHAGTIMAALSQTAVGPAARGRGYWDWKAPWCGGFAARAHKTENGWRLADAHPLPHPVM